MRPLWDTLSAVTGPGFPKRRGSFATRGQTTLRSVLLSAGNPSAGNPSAKQSAVTIKNLAKRYGGVLAVDDVSFSIQEGEIFGIIGPNGAGKTTTVECISGLRVQDSGSISVFGLSPQRDRYRIREFLGVQLQESALPPRLRVGEALELFASFYARPLDPKEVLQTLSIKNIERTAFKNLSEIGRAHV